VCGCHSATRARVVTQLVTEAVLLALPPTASALIRVLPLGFDYRVFGFVLIAATVATVMFAVLPSLQATRVSAHASPAR
jgi:hypothetical protein